MGTVVPGTLVIDAPGGTGSPLLDAAGERPLVARLSRAASWPVHLPDVIGVALRIPAAGPDGGPADLLFASTGTGRLTRYVLRFHLSATAGPLTTMFPLLGAGGHLVFRLDPEGPGRYRFSCSRNSGPWRGLGRVVLDVPAPERPPHRARGAEAAAGPDDAGLRFRPVAQPPAGLTVPVWLRAARAPAYGLARRVGRERA
ncbi:hypothetical protein E7744_00880 [Citricoccus sp. SGAir0253]|nr:hypothetical protein E7744_00880 [Citricoccus sp. SGAir0253]